VYSLTRFVITISYILLFVMLSGLGSYLLVVGSSVSMAVTVFTRLLTRKLIVLVLSIKCLRPVLLPSFDFTSYNSDLIGASDTSKVLDRATRLQFFEL
jgi:hypothetical protein